MRHYSSFLKMLAVCIGCVFVVSVAISSSAENSLTPEILLQKHLDAIGTTAARTAAKTRVVQGTATYKLLVGGSGQIVGNDTIASDGRSLHMLLKINALQFRGERFISNGDKVYVAGTYDNKTRSEFGEFLHGEDVLLREGLLGGVLTTGWPLLDLDGRKAKLLLKGSRKVDGVNLLAATYKPKKGFDMDITLFFDPETFRHVMTSYSISRAAGLLAASEGGEVASARQNEIRYLIQERFSDFRTNDGITLPWHYDLRYTEETQSGFTKSVDWDIVTTNVSNNVPIDPKNFVLP